MYVFSLNDHLFLPHVGCDVSFTLRAGAGLILTGENGLGKTTLVRRFYQQFDKKNSVSFVTQDALGFFYDRQLETFRDIFLQTCGESINQNLLLEMWRELGLSDKGSRLLSELSGGERQSLKLICGLAKIAEIYILDEPSQFLDPAKKKYLQQLLAGLLLQNKSVLMVEHDFSWSGASWETLELKAIDGKVQESKRWTT